VAYSQATAPALTGVLLAAMSFGSLLSGIALGATTRRWTLTGQVRVGSVTLTAAILPLAFISAPMVFAGMAFLLGLNFSVVMIGSFGLAERMTPRSRITEGLALMGSGLSLGMAAGTALAGVIIDTAGASPALGLAAVFATTAMVVFWSTARSTSSRERAADQAEIADEAAQLVQPQPAATA
jgi:predicted MFS family arabinose efflux permease